MSDGPSAPAVADVQDPLPESSWLWRRVFTFVVTGVILYFLWCAMDRLSRVAMIAPAEGVPALLALCKWIISLTILMTTYYLIAPSAEQIVKVVQVAGMLRSGVQIAGRLVSDGDRTDTAKTAGRPAPPIPAQPEPSAPSVAPEAGSTDEGPPWAGQKENK